MMRTTLGAAATALVLLVLPTESLAQAPGYDTPVPKSFTTEAPPGGEPTRVGGAVPNALPAPPADDLAVGELPDRAKVERKRRCVRRDGRRICRVFVNGVHRRTCVRRRGGRERCRSIRPRVLPGPRAASASASFRPSAASRAAVR